MIEWEEGGRDALIREAGTGACARHASAPATFHFRRAFMRRWHSDFRIFGCSSSDGTTSFAAHDPHVASIAPRCGSR